MIGKQHLNLILFEFFVGTSHQNHSIVHRKIIAPTISLQTGKIVYDWHVGLNNKSSVRAHVDPTNVIRVVWTDSIPGRAAGNCWITEMKIPLDTSAPGSRMGDIRVGRRWVV